MTTQLGPRCFGIRKLFLSHGHHDHISGVSSLIGARCVTRGDNNAPLSIYYPSKCQEIEALKEYVSKTRKPTFELQWIPIEPDETIKLESPNKTVKSFRVEHTPNSLGFSIVEKRKKVKKEFQSLTGQEFQKLHTQGIKLSENYFANLWGYSGDAYQLNPKEIEGAEWFFCDTTFLKKEDRKEKTHFTAQEAMELAKAANVKRFVGIHISPRYTNKERIECQTQIQKEIPKSLLLPLTKTSIIDSSPNNQKTGREEKTLVL